MRPKNVRIYVNCKNSDQKDATDDDNVKIVINGKILQNLKAPTSDRYKNFYFSGNLDKGVTKKLDLGLPYFTHFENSVEIWYDETPFFGTMEVQLSLGNDLGNYLYTNYSLLAFPLPLQNSFTDIRDYILSQEFEIEKKKSNISAIDALWHKAMIIHGDDIIEASNLLVFACYLGLAKAPFETKIEAQKRIEALPKSIFDNDNKDNKDKLQHFFGNTNFVLRFGKNITKVAGWTKEQIDEYFGSTGFDPEDIEANVYGIRFAANLKNGKNVNPSNFLIEK